MHPRAEGQQEVEPGKRLDRSAFAAGARACLPVLPGVGSFGIICGVAMVASGIPPLVAVLMSCVVYAGASMVASAQLLSSGTPALFIILTTLFINLRFMMYSASLRPHLASLPLRLRFLFGYLIADNAYAMAIARFADHPDDRAKPEFYAGAALPIWVVWQITVACGAFIGAGLPASWRLEFAAPLSFIAMSVPLLRDRAMIAAAVAAGITVVAANALPFRMAVIAAALVGMAAGMIVERKLA